MATIFKSTGHAQFDKLLEKATSNLLLEPEWASIMQICDLIRQKDCQPKYAMGQIKKKLHHPNPHVGFYALQVLESVVKNCGSPVHEEVATKVFMEEMRDLAKTSHHDNIREKVLELIQTWAHAFRKIPSYRAVVDVLNIMKTEGAKFPPLVEADAMFVADQAPEWADGECCHRCRVEFSFTQRKHHCRACGQIFCNKCSGKECTLPRFGIEKEVRVCDSCFEKYGKEGSVPSFEDHVHTPGIHHHPHHVHATSRANGGGGGSGSSSVSGSVGKTVSTGGPGGPSPADKAKELELAEEEQLQLALAISQSEAEAKEQEMKAKQRQMLYKPPEAQISPPSSIQPISAMTTTTDPSSPPADAELSRYLNRSYWETKSSGITSPSPPLEKQTFIPSAPLKQHQVSSQDHDVSEQDTTIDLFMENLRSQIEMFVNRMKSNSSRGRPIANDTSVQSLFMSITHMHSQLLGYIQVQDNARGKFELLQDKLNQVRDARAALDDLRNEHAEALRRQAEEQERIRAFQMAQKLALMRQKKNEYLQYQRQLAMQRMQEQEREMQMRIAAEQAKIGQQPTGPQQPQHHPQWGYGGMPSQGQNVYTSQPQQQQWMNNQGPPQQVLNSPTSAGGGQMVYNSPHPPPPDNSQQQQQHDQMMMQHQQQQGQQMPGQPPQQQMSMQQGQPIPMHQGPPPPPQMQQQQPPPPIQQQQMAPPPPQQMQPPQNQDAQQQQHQSAPPPPAIAELISFD